MEDQKTNLVDKAHNYISEKALSFFGGLFMEEKSDGKWVASLGRVAFWCIFGHLFYAWHAGGEPTASELNAFYALLTYQGAKIGRDAIVDGVSAFKGQS